MFLTTTKKTKDNLCIVGLWIENPTRYFQELYNLKNDVWQPSPVLIEFKFDTFFKTEKTQLCL